MDLKTVLRAQWDRATAIACTALGGLLLLVGWLGVSDTPFLAEQAPYILSGGVGGVFLLGVGATLWISADLRDEWRKLDRIEAALVDGRLRYVDETTPELPVQRRTAPVAEAEAVLETAGTVRDRDGELLEAQARRSRSRATAARTATTAPVASTSKRGRPGVGHA